MKRGELLTDEIRSNWSMKKSVRKNFDSLGLAYDANAALEKYMDEVDPYLSPEEFEVEEDKGHLEELLQVRAQATLLVIIFLLRSLLQIQKEKRLWDPENNIIASVCMTNMASTSWQWLETAKKITGSTHQNS